MDVRRGIGRRDVLTGLAASAVSIPHAGRIIGQSSRLEAGIVQRHLSLEHGIDALWKRTLETGNEYVQTYVQYNDGKKPPYEWLPARVWNRGNNVLEVEHVWDVMDPKRSVECVYEVHTHSPSTVSDMVLTTDKLKLPELTQGEVKEIRRRPGLQTSTPPSPTDLLDHAIQYYEFPFDVDRPAFFRAAKVGSGLYVHRALANEDLKQGLAVVDPQHESGVRAHFGMHRHLDSARNILKTVLYSTNADGLSGALRIIRDVNSPQFARFLKQKPEFAKQMRSFRIRKGNVDDRTLRTARYLVFRFLMELLSDPRRYKTEFGEVRNFLFTRTNRAAWEEYERIFRAINDAPITASLSERSEAYDHAVIRMTFESRVMNGNDALFWESGHKSVSELKKRAAGLAEYLYFVPNDKIRALTTLLNR